MEEDQNYNHSEFLDLLPELVFEIDEELNIKFLNQSCEKILGYRKSELLNNKISLDDFIVPVDIKKIKNNISKNFGGNHTSGNSYRIFNKAKEELTLEIHNSHIKKDGKVVGLRCIAIDITEKEKKFITLSSQEKHFREIFQNSPIPYQSLDINGNFLNINPAWEKLLGYTMDEIIGNNFSHILNDENKIKFKKSFEKFKNNGEINNIQYDLLTKEGDTIFVNYNGKVEYDEQHKIYRTHCVFNDITLQIKAEKTLIESEQNLRELNATKDKFFSIIAHDLKNPFNDLMGFTQLLSMNIDKYDKTKIEQFIKIIHQSSKLAHNLLENLLDWSGSQTGNLNYHPEKTLINALIDENVDLLESTAHNKNIQIYSEPDMELYAYVDKNMVRTIIRNLISNAIKYTNQGGIIKVSGNKNNEFCEITVSDNGIGISKKYIDKIFKIDEGFSTIGTEKEKGTGLGLILCKEFVEKNGGKLWVKSEPDKGSAFSFTLPSSEP
ncbi:MAG: PAS domain-containing sensor histidine kinase [Bacteroidales bacterium]|nr:PAS domain-containing sensor histidine kinase [Bacteroidales bacterium]